MNPNQDLVEKLLALPESVMIREVSLILSNALSKLADPVLFINGIAYRINIQAIQEVIQAHENSQTQVLVN